MRDSKYFLIRNPYFQKIICFVFAILLCGLIELSVRIIFPGEDELDKILNVLQQDSLLFWRLKPNLNVKFQSVRVETNSLGLRVQDRMNNIVNSKQDFRIICLGASPTFGWGVEIDDAYPSRLERILAEKFDPDRRIEVINAGIIGYTSYQGVTFFKNEILKLSPDLVTISYVVNDVDKYRFYRNDGRSDKEQKPKNKILVYFENIFEKSKLFRILKKNINRKKNITTKFSGEIKNVYSENRRVSFEDYKKNLDVIIDIAKRNNIKVVLLKIKVISPFSGRQIVDSFKYKADKYIYRGLDYAKQAKYNKAIEEVENALKYNPYSSKASYYLGVYSAKKKEFEKAEVYFQKAKEMELFECAKLSRRYNQIMEVVADKNRVPLVDAVLAFEDFSPKDKDFLFINPEHDFVHPSVMGHKVISEEIANILIKYNLLVKD
ncbi:MAG: hypothetical protein KAS51_03210 [Candidatus Omnitrophica bacterium]|nr:hypothetical protein [Candidatus Omnitrophota bacterium]